MNTHPNADEWMSFLYGEDTPERHAELDQHLQGCPACQRQVEAWRASMAALTTYTLPSRPRALSFAPALRWAAAAVVVVSLGFALGRTTSPNPTLDRQALRASIQQELDARLGTVRVELARSLEQQHASLLDAFQTVAADAAAEESTELLTKLTKVLEAQRAADQRALLAALNQLEEQQLDRYAALRRDLDTVAVNADDGLTQAQEQLMALANLNQAAAEDAK